MCECVCEVKFGYHEHVFLGTVFHFIAMGGSKVSKQVFFI